MTYNPSQRRHPKGAPVAGQWATDASRGSAAEMRPRPLQMRDDWDELSEQEKQADVRSYVLDALHEHGLDDWGFRLGRGRQLFGTADYRKKMISVSKYAIEHSQEQAKDTAMHEVAHAIAGPHANHGQRWRSIAQALGSNGQAKHSVQIEKPKSTVSRRWRGSIVHFEEGVTTFQYGNETYTVQEVHRKNLIAKADGREQLYRISIDHAGKCLHDEKLSVARDELNQAMTRVGASKGHRFAQRAAHGLEGGPEALDLQGKRAKRDALQAMIAGADAMPSYDGEQELEAAEIVAEHDLSAHITSWKSPLGQSMQQIVIVTGDRQRISTLIPRSEAKSIAGFLSNSKAVLTEMESVGWDYEHWGSSRPYSTMQEFINRKNWAESAKNRLAPYLDQL